MVEELPEDVVATIFFFLDDDLDVPSCLHFLVD